MKLATLTPTADALPERYPYRDEGCEVSPSCLRCPLAQCKYDDPDWFQRQKRDEREQRNRVGAAAGRPFGHPGGVPLRPQPAGPCSVS